MANSNTDYAQKTKLREMIFLAYFDDQISRDSAIARIGVSNRQFIRLQNRFSLDKSLPPLADSHTLSFLLLSAPSASLSPSRFRFPFRCL